MNEHWIWERKPITIDNKTSIIRSMCVVESLIICDIHLMYSHFLTSRIMRGFSKVFGLTHCSKFVQMTN